jgi:hypothetical protein
MRRLKEYEVDTLSVKVNTIPVMASGSATKEHFQQYLRYFENEQTVGERVIPE